MQHVVVKLCHKQLVCWVGAIEFLKFGAPDETRADSGQWNSAVHDPYPILQAAVIGGTVKGGLVNPIGLASNSIDVKRHCGISKNKSFNIDSGINPCRTSFICDIE